MIKKFHIKKVLAGLLTCVCLVAAMPSETEAAVTGQEMSVNLFGKNDTRVGRYKVNYIGNTNHYTWYNPSGGVINKEIYNDLGGGYENSSTATLERSTDTSKIEYAYLVWQTRAKQGTVDPIVLVTPDGKRGNIYPDYAINDWRVVGNNPGMRSMFCMAKDVTGLVRSSGYGKYTVCNIPYFHWGDDEDRGGGESPGSWQLIVVEELSSSSTTINCHDPGDSPPPRSSSSPQ